MSREKDVERDPISESTEQILDPSLVIIDAHHHLYERPGIRYMAEEMLTDARAGHNIRATVFVQARSMYRQDGPESLRCIGETEFAAQVASDCLQAGMSAPRLCAAIVGHADLMLSDDVAPILEAHIQAGQGRFRGVRMPLTSDEDPSLLNPTYPTHALMMEDKAFLRGFAQLSQYNLSFDAWLFFHQLPQFVALSRRFPHTPMVLNHCGGVLGIGRYRHTPKEVREVWLNGILELAKCENVVVKLGGLGLPLSGIGDRFNGTRPSSEELANAWRPWFEPCIESFGPSRCMFESNFPADKTGHDYVVGWNAMKQIVKGASTADKNELFWRCASRFYRISNFTHEPVVDSKAAFNEAQGSGSVDFYQIK